MECPSHNQENAELLLAHVSRKLDAERAATLEQHIAACPTCREYAAAQFAVWEALEAWDAPEVSADFDRRLYERIERQPGFAETLLRPLRAFFRVRFVPVAAAGLLIAAGVWLGYPGRGPVVNTPQSAEIEALPQDQAATALQQMQTMQEFSKAIHSDSVDPRM
jgi:anti-sigma factor RsiW